MSDWMHDAGACHKKGLIGTIVDTCSVLYVDSINYLKVLSTFALKLFKA